MRPDPIFLLGAHKSGTSLIRALFDGISRYAVLPIETHPFQILDYGIRYPYRKQNPKSLHFGEAQKKGLAWIRKSNINVDKYSDSLTIDMFDEDRFQKEIEKNQSCMNEKRFLEDYFSAVFISYKGNHSLRDTQRFVEKSVENMEFAADLKKIYPEAKFIHIIRNPYSNLVSLRKYKGKKKYPFLDKPIKALYESYYYLDRNERLIDNYEIIKYEDLISRPENTLRRMCENLNITFNSKMLVPTINNGNSWKGNSTTDMKFSGISDEKLYNWKKEICPLEIAFVNKLFPHVLDRFKYEKLDTKKKLRRNSYESLRTYCYNRIYLSRAVALF
ncbi:hypothetical protein C7S20_17465 [Christiangramia fulva]|uniref:Sulfotransferase n=1 Tax=Christiangramia fulva TaxID=2126553 RepID=A0A2R3Z9G7_9FLAO|nr:sulfotransferase [Christiangramia fulva]AVR46906.1 hypothetical protein C7S20_17465 [Christiangramia fulva]